MILGLYITHDICLLYSLLYAA